MPDAAPAGTWHARGYTAAVTSLALVAVLLTVPAQAVAAPGPAALALGLLLVLTQSQRVLLWRRDSEQLEVTLASVFVMALVLTGPVWFLLASQATACTVEALRRQRGPGRLAVDNAQLALTALLARAVYTAASGRAFLSDGAALSPSDVIPALAAGAALFLIHHVLFGLHLALSSARPVLAHLRGGLPLQVATSGVLLPCAPVLVVALDFSLLLAPLLLLPLGAVRRSAVLLADREGLALHDGLTRLPNRLLLQDRTGLALTDAARTGGVTGVLLIDLDHFKDINDTLGHYVGDRLLCAVGERLRGSLRDGDTVARLGGDEFAILACSLVGDDDAERLARRIIATLAQPFSVDGVRLDVSASVGIALAPEHGTDVVTLLQRADVALYAAKEHRGTFAVYSPDRDLHSVERLSFLGELREAITAGQLVVHYQPKVEALTGELVGVEALVRWQHPTRGLIFPDEFIAVAENTGLIRALTLEVLDQSLRLCSELREEGIDLGVAVNVSVRCLSDLELPRQVASLLARWELPAQALTLEVTETSIMADPARTNVVLGLLRDLGVTLSIDDFGTGYSSLSYLRRIEAHELKIDRSFVFAMATNSNDAVIVRSTIELGHNLGLSIVAEGVETADAWKLLRDLGCDVIQGYHLSKPLPPPELRAWIEAYRQPLHSVVPSGHDRDGRAAGHL